MEITGKKNVIGMWTALKGICVALVILAHSVHATGSIFGVDVYPIPFRVLTKAGASILFTFFILNGYLFKPGKTNRKIWEQFAGYLKIYLITLLGMAATQIVHNVMISAPWGEGVALLFAGGLYGAGRSTWLFGVQLTAPYALWFFMTLMLGNLILNLIMRLKNERLRKGILFGIPVVLFLLNGIFGQGMVEFLWKLPFYPSATLLTVTLLYIGYCLKKENVFFRPIGLKWKLGFLILGLTAFIFGQIDMEMGQYRLLLLDYIGAICGVLAFIYAYLLFVKPEWRLLDPFVWIGRRSLWIIPLHCIEGLLFAWEGMSGLKSLGFYLSTAVIFLLRSVALIAACMLMEKASALVKRSRIKKIER